MKRVRGVAGGLGRVVLTVVVVALFATALTELAPGTAAERAARAAGVMPADDSAVPGALRRDLVARVAALHGLDRSLGSRLAGQARALARGDLGRSWRTGAPVRGPLLRGAGRTAALIAAALMLALLAGIGSAAARQLARRSGARLVVSIVVSLLLVTPPVWIGLVLLKVAGPSVVWALISLAALPAALVSRHASRLLESAARAPHAIAARARGLSRARLVLVHGCRESAATLVSIAPGLVGYSVGASMVIERVFGIRGLGAHLADAAAIGDAPVVVAAVALIGGAVAATSVLAQALARRFDPRLAEPQ